MKKICSIAMIIIVLFTNSLFVCAEGKHVDIISEEDVEQYFQDSVFIGDSVALGFSNYASKNQVSYLKNMQFLTCGGFGVNNALKELTPDSTQPIYQGQKRYIWDTIKLMGAKKVFLSLGINDLNPCRTKIVSKYEEVINKILEVAPDTEINIVSISLVLKGAERGRINNENIKEVNTQLQELALERGWGYIDIASLLADENGDLNKGYCSDGFVHLSRTAYQNVWYPALRSFAIQKLSSVNSVWLTSSSIICCCKDEVKVYGEPYLSDQIILKIPKETLLQVTGQTQNGFYRVNLGDGKEYYITCEGVVEE